MFSGRCATVPGFDRQQIFATIAAEHAWVNAAINGEIAAFAGLMSDDYAQIVFRPATTWAEWDLTRKGTWVELLRSGREKYESVDLRNLNVHLDGDIATVTGEYSQKATKEGEGHSGAGMYVGIWARRNGRWQVVNSVFA